MPDEPTAEPTYTALADVFEYVLVRDDATKVVYAFTRDELERPDTPSVEVPPPIEGEPPVDPDDPEGARDA